MKRVEKILPKVQNTSDVKWLFNVFNCYEDLLRDESLKPEDRNNVENIIAETVRRLADLGYSVADRGDGEEIRKTEEYNV